MCVNLIQAAARRHSAELDKINSAVSDCFGNACIKCLYELKEMSEMGVCVSQNRRVRRAVQTLPVWVFADMSLEVGGFGLKE